MSVNSDAETAAALAASVHGGVADPYVGEVGAALVFPCATDTCSVPDQDVAALEKLARRDGGAPRRDGGAPQGRRRKKAKA